MYVQIYTNYIFALHKCSLILTTTDDLLTAYFYVAYRCQQPDEGTEDCVMKKLRKNNVTQLKDWPENNCQQAEPSPEGSCSVNRYKRRG